MQCITTLDKVQEMCEHVQQLKVASNQQNLKDKGEACGAEKGALFLGPQKQTTVDNFSDVQFDESYAFEWTKWNVNYKLQVNVDRINERVMMML